jgi:hypothetical protein
VAGAGSAAAERVAAAGRVMVAMVVAVGTGLVGSAEKARLEKVPVVAMGTMATGMV